LINIYYKQKAPLGQVKTIDNIDFNISLDRHGLLSRRPPNVVSIEQPQSNGANAFKNSCPVRDIIWVDDIR
jgi:hypothetical protein